MIYIGKKISDRVLIISPALNGQGGIASVVNNMALYYESFNFLASTGSKNIIEMVLCFVRCVMMIPYYVFFKKIKIVHIHGASKGSFLRKMILINICSMFRLKIIYHIHGGGFSQFYRKWNKFNIIKNTLEKADVLVVLSESWANYFNSLSLNVPIKKINNIINPPAFIGKGNELNLKNNNSDTLTRFLFLGKISSAKGVFDLLDVIIGHVDELRGKFILYIGGNGEVDKLNKLIEENKLQGLVLFKGWVDNEGKSDLFQICDVYILPSYKEGLPLSILEAMSYGLPIVSTKVGGIPEIVEHGKNGLLIEPGDGDDLYRSLLFFINNRGRCYKWGQDGKEKAQDFYPKSVIPELALLYKTLLK